MGITPNQLAQVSVFTTPANPGIGIDTPATYTLLDFQAVTPAGTFAITAGNSGAGNNLPTELYANATTLNSNVNVVALGGETILTHANFVPVLTTGVTIGNTVRLVFCQVGNSYGDDNVIWIGSLKPTT